MKWNKNIKIFTNYIFGPVIFVILCVSLYHQMASQNDLPQRWSEIKSSWMKPAFWFAFFLVFFNWGLETIKWRRLLKPLERLNFKTAFRSVLAGCSITLLTPNRVGEFGGRIMYVQEEHRVSAILLTFLGSLSQLFVTIFMGTIGLIIFNYFRQDDALLFNLIPVLAGKILLYACLATTILLCVLYFRLGVLIKIATRFDFLKKYVKYLHFLYEFSRKELLRILLLSFLRYMVFILQYMLLLSVFEVDISADICFWLLTIFYLVLTIAPTIGLTELPLRAAAAVELLHLYSGNIIGIQAASLSIWIINLALPALAGSILIFGIKILKDK